MKFKIKIAETVIEVNCLSDVHYYFCDKYIVNNANPKYYINLNKEDIEYEKIKNRDYDSKTYSDLLYERLAIYRKISETLLVDNIFLTHGSVVATDMEHCYMFTASSGTGKTTHTKLWLKNLPGSFVVNGDKPLLKVEDNQVLACGTPWCGKEGWNTNCMVPLKGIVILERAEENSIKEIPFKDAFPILLQQTYRPKDVTKMQETLMLLSQIKNHVKFYKMKMNNFKEDAFLTSYNALVNN